MPQDHIRYDLLVREAMRGVVRRVIADVAKNGLPGEHHFYISFNTAAPGVRISPRLRTQYPDEMTIVLQHQFWDLAVTDAGFEVGLSFSGIPEKLIVPFEAIRGFFDPSVQFGLEFEVAAEPAAAAERPKRPALSGPQPAQNESKQPAARPPRERPARRSASQPSKGDTEPAKTERPAEAPPASGKSESGAEVVRLDRFRKK